MQAGMKDSNPQAASSKRSPQGKMVKDKAPGEQEGQ